VIFNRNKPEYSGNEAGQAFKATGEPLGKVLSRRFWAFVIDRVPLFEAICVAISAHILAFPVFWFAGWALPWPKSPEILTIIELDLSNWTQEGAVTKKVTDIIKSEMHADK
jgi:hypothetical protein